MSQDESNWFAVDFGVLGGDDLLYKNDGSANSDFFAFGKDILAVAPGRVVIAIDGVPDNLPGHSDSSSSSGNTVVIKHAEHEFSVYSHLKRDSIKVKVGDEVVAGRVIAQCGNSGRSTGAHLHFGLMNSETTGFATGFPPTFHDVAVKRGGEPALEKEYEPKRGDRVRQNRAR